MEDIVDINGWSDERVLRECIHYGEEARRWRNRFLGLLPEIQRRKLYEKHGCTSIIEFAKKVGGVNEEQVSRVLNVYRKFESTPILQELLINGEVSINKMARVASIATPENEEILANQVKLLSKSAVETLVRDIQIAKTASVPGHKSQLITETLQIAVHLSPEIAQELISLRNKGIDIDQELKEFLEQRKWKIEQEKEELAQAEQKKGSSGSRYVPQKVRDILTKEHGTKCSITTCSKPFRQIHHTRRFSIDPSHDPHYLALLCKEHHEMAHTVDQKVQDQKKKVKK